MEACVALATGASRGLGFETARLLLGKGLVVVLAGRDAAAIERARRILRHEGPAPRNHRADGRHECRDVRSDTERKMKR